ncbi:unnamed protein product [[Candida] boidinii]|uniref:Unnamed protein product n=1 Tax=Candida boidinii TaxID=5477 RepID=A0A9W6STR0_CANBO|nr:hypothetical protein B5S30_g3245 [[Candida] boidinii]OWB83342.1 hypothetical protein B5S33_g1971 [[Candida] boidinii]GME66554.1 unnamed protein product [[Candida] boidinii]
MHVSQRMNSNSTTNGRRLPSALRFSNRYPSHSTVLSHRTKDSDPQSGKTTRVSSQTYSNNPLYNRLSTASNTNGLINSPRTKASISTGSELFKRFTGEVGDPFESSNNSESGNIEKAQFDSKGPGSRTIQDILFDPELEYLLLLKRIFNSAYEFGIKAFMLILAWVHIILSYLKKTLENRVEKHGIDTDNTPKTNKEREISPNNQRDTPRRDESFIPNFPPSEHSTPFQQDIARENMFNSASVDSSSPSLSRLTKLNNSNSLKNICRRLDQEKKDAYGTRFFERSVGFENEPNLEAMFMRSVAKNDYTSRQKFLSLASDSYNFSDSLSHDANNNIFEQASNSEGIAKIAEISSSIKNLFKNTRNSTENYNNVLRTPDFNIPESLGNLEWLKNDNDDYIVNLESTELFKSYQKVMEERKKLRKLVSLSKLKESHKLKPLSFDQLTFVNSVWHSSELNKVIVDAYNIPITVKDLKTLDNRKWLNDNIIDFYMKLIVARSQNSAELLPKIHIFSTHFYSTLSSKGYKGVARWAKRAKINVTQLDYIFVPVNLNQVHWALGVINNKDRSFQYYDSLFGHAGPEIISRLEEYLTGETKRLYGDDYSGADYTDYERCTAVDCPQQENGSDCGVFTCTAVDYISRSSGLFYSQADMLTIRQRMAYEICQNKLLTH